MDMTRQNTACRNVDAPITAATMPRMRICFFGDSFVNGTGDDDCLGWPGRLCAHARQRGVDITLYNLGVRRDTSRDIAARWMREADTRLPPDHDGRVVFSFGVNDCSLEGEQQRVTEADTLALTRAMLREASARWPVLMIGPPCTGDASLDERVKRLSEQMSVLCHELSVPFLPLFDRMNHSAIWQEEARLGDGIHPNRQGYALISQAVQQWDAWLAWLPAGQPQKSTP